MKTKTIKLSDGWARPDTADGNPRRFRVEQITDSVEFQTGTFLEKNDVDLLCKAHDWKVTIVRPTER
jgi:hypothetical protein